jgi:hypothetical protein
LGPGGKSILGDSGWIWKLFLRLRILFVYRTIKAFIDVNWFDTPANALLKLDVLQELLHTSSSTIRTCNLVR